MFERREKQSKTKRAREFLWPSMGWIRVLQYYRHRMGRLPGSAYYVAAGFASGVAISFTPFVGLHMLLSLLLAKVLRASFIASAFGTIIGNPWTFPFIWVLVYKVGTFLIGEGVGVEMPENLTFDFVWNHKLDILLPMTVGAIPLSIMAWMVAFFSIHGIIDRYKTRRMRRLKKALLKQFREHT